MNGVPRARIARLMPSGELDPSFDPGTGAARPVDAFALLSSGDVIAGGRFVAMDDFGRNRIARLFAGTGAPALPVQVRSHMGGPYDPVSGSMQDQLRAAGLVPTGEPYTAQGYPHVGGGGELIDPSVLGATGPNAIVDWVVLELRAAGSPATVLATRSALVQRDGDVVDLDGISLVPFYLPPGNYHVAIRHRNHLGVMSATPIALSSAPTLIDFTGPATPTWGTDACQNVNGTMVLWPGDANFDGEVKYTGANNDRDVVLQAVGGSIPNNIVTGYWGADVNLDGQVKYTGAENDRDIILQTIGGVVPTAVRVEQLP